MCGICGIFEFKQGTQSLGVWIRHMAERLRHRGPDEDGFWTQAAVSLGHRRLKVIDLESGRQPMSTEDGRFVITFNGEIYNYRQIRQDLEREACVFRTHSDTESLLALFCRKGLDALPELKGMFAFAVYDRQERKLTLAVDAFGKKPLYYYHDENIFLFASEPKAILTHPAVSKKVDPEALEQYLAFEYVPAPRTIYGGISKMQAGTALTVSADGGLRMSRYHAHEWASESRSEEDWKKDFEGLFLSAVEKRLVSDVPLGIFLSGGVDSSAVLWAAKKIMPSKKIETFTIEFDDPSFDEGPQARAVSNYFKTEHRVEKCSAVKMLAEHENILSSLDEPLADASYLPTYMLCRMARRHVTVALSGDGGDEVFCGYPTFEAHLLAQSADTWPWILKKIIAKGVSLLPVSMKNMSFDFKAKQFMKGTEYAPFLRDQVWLGAFSPREISRVLPVEGGGGDPLDALKIISDHSWGKGADTLQKLQEFYYYFYMQGDILVKTDRAAMAHALEVRSPFLDDDLVKAMNRMPTSLKMKNGKTKYFLKHCMRGKIPAAVLDCPKKGFGIPVAQWIRSDLKDNFKSVLSAKKIASGGLFDSGYVQTLLDEHGRGVCDHRKKLWTLYVFEQWKKNWL